MLRSTRAKLRTSHRKNVSRLYGSYVGAPGQHPAPFPTNPGIGVERTYTNKKKLEKVCTIWNRKLKEKEILDYKN